MEKPLKKGVKIKQNRTFYPDVENQKTKFTNNKTKVKITLN